MQVQIKKQLKIELDEADIIQAVGAFLKANDVNVSSEDLAKINFVKSPQTGLRATLNVTEAETIEDEPRCSPVVVDTRGEVVGQGIVNGEAVSTASVVPEPITTETAEPEPVEVEPVVTDEPGQVEPSSVEDVMPSVSQIAEMIKEEPTPTPPEAKGLF